MATIDSETYRRMAQRAKESLGYFNPDVDALVLDTWEIVGKPFKKITKEGQVTVYPKARAVLLNNGSLDILQGGMSATISEKDARKILGTELNRKLTKSLKIKTSVK